MPGMRGFGSSRRDGHVIGQRLFASLERQKRTRHFSGLNRVSAGRTKRDVRGHKQGLGFAQYPCGVLKQQTLVGVVSHHEFQTASMRAPPGGMAT